MIYPWKLNFWQSGEWQVCNERIKDMEKAGIKFNPTRELLFDALRRTQPGDVQVAIIGQDPYPQTQYATGRAFSIPSGIPPDQFPPTLRTIFNEYCSDLRYPFPRTGNLQRWTDQGVLLWNAIPIVRSGESLSCDWDEWSFLTREIIQRLSERGIVFAFLGAVAKRYLGEVDLTKNEIILTSHPSPRGSRNSKTPFEGSRLFSTINDKLHAQGLEAIDWRLPDVSSPRQSNQTRERGSGLDGDSHRILDNITGANLGDVRDARGNVIR